MPGNGIVQRVRPTARIFLDCADRNEEFNAKTQRLHIFFFAPLRLCVFFLSLFGAWASINPLLVQKYRTSGPRDFETAGARWIGMILTNPPRCGVGCGFATVQMAGAATSLVVVQAIVEARSQSQRYRRCLLKNSSFGHCLRRWP